jgi:hypothetical protein
LATIVPVAPLILVDLTGDGPLKMVYRPISPARAIIRRPTMVGHLLRSSEQAGRRVLSLASERGALHGALRARDWELMATAVPRLLDCRSDLAAIIHTLEIASG